jgi:hypothetical protein
VWREMPLTIAPAWKPDRVSGLANRPLAAIGGRRLAG